MLRAHDIGLLHGEEVEEALRPHPLSFLKYHIVAIYLIIVTGALHRLYSYLQANLNALGFLGSIFSFVTGMPAQDAILLTVFWVVLIVSGILIGLLWVSKTPLICMVGVGATGTFLELYYHYPPFTKLWVLIIAAALGMVLTELYRRGHWYFITNYRIITRKRFIGREERDLIYDRITDVYVSQSLLGRIFNFGTVIPITASGFGTGEEMAMAGIHAASTKGGGMIGVGAGGGRGVQRPRAATYFSLYGIPKPRRVRGLIVSRQLQAREAPILRRIEELLKEKTMED